MPYKNSKIKTNNQKKIKPQTARRSSHQDLRNKSELSSKRVQDQYRTDTKKKDKDEHLNPCMFHSILPPVHYSNYT